MINISCRAYPSRDQILKIEEGFRIFQFIRNKTLLPFMEGEKGYNKYALNRRVLMLRREYPDIAGRLNAQASQCAGFRTWQAISKFYSNCKEGSPGKKGYPKFKRNNRSIEYQQQNGWKLSPNRRSIRFTDGLEIDKLHLSKSDLSYYTKKQIKRVRIIRKGGMYFVNFVIDVKREEILPPTGKTVGLDMGLTDFYTDSNGVKIPNPKHYYKSEKKLKRLQRKVSKKVKGSNNRRKASKKAQKAFYRLSCQRKDFVVKTARCVVRSNDLVAIEDLQIQNMVKNRRLSKSISQICWGLFKQWVLYYGQIYGRQVKVVNPAYTSQDCSRCGSRSKKELSERTHSCKECGLELDRDHNAAINILRLGLAPARKLPRGTGKVTLRDTLTTA